MLVDTRPWPPVDRPARTGSPTGWVAVGAVGVGAALLAGRVVAYAPGACLARTHLGLACPACGLTHLADHLLAGRLGPAVAQDLPGTVLLLVLAATAVVQVLARLGRAPAPTGRLLPVTLGALLVAHWALTLVTGGATA